MLKLTSNALVTVVEAEQDCFEELFEAVSITADTLHCISTIYQHLFLHQIFGERNTA